MGSETAPQEEIHTWYHKCGQKMAGEGTGQYDRGCGTYGYRFSKQQCLTAF